MNDIRQVTAALDRANAIRFAQARVRRQIGALERQEGMRLVCRLLDGELEASEDLELGVETIKLGRLLSAIRGFGPRRIREILIVTGLNPLRVGRRVRELTAFERGRIARHLEAESRDPLNRSMIEVRDRLDELAEDEWITAAEIGRQIGRPAGGVAPTLSALMRRGIAERRDVGKRQIEWRLAR